MKIFDLTHKLEPEVPSWDGNIGFELSAVVDYKDCTPPDLFRIQKIKCGLSMGTHMDAPAHVIPDGRTIDKLKIEELVADCLVIDVSKDSNSSYMVMPSVINEFESKHGKIKPNDFVLFYTGWSEKWSQRDKYHNGHKFPSVHKDTAKLLVERNISGLGIDTFSTDTGVDGFPVHNVILGADKYLVENVANAKDLPATGAKIYILPMKIKDATEAPIRLIAKI